MTNVRVKTSGSSSGPVDREIFIHLLDNRGRCLPLDSPLGVNVITLQQLLKTYQLDFGR